jgi:CBS domain-containing protein
MTPVAHTIPPDAPLPDALRLMRKARIHRVLVMKDGILHGIITPFDALEVLAAA